ncbi:leucine-rich repeat domain-containing protein [uncultured Muribaculum sp.]|uniref:leucine-rich repeat domain-containing protein n=1 Tax=uncultured Muribaculum sp. TaxID=1918613 RepID=UPI00260FADF0|nr:leucine-rich repeat domain-containing protein [uncultured Muribaculum sp.]
MYKILLTVAVMLIGIIDSQAFTVDGLNYSVDGTVATVTGATSKSITRLTIPATVTYGGKTYTVDKLSGTAFHDYTSLKELVIEDSETYLGSQSYINKLGHNVLGNPFDGCPLEKVYVGRNLAKRIGAGKYEGDITPINTTAENMDLTLAGKTTFIINSIAEYAGLSFSNKTYIKSLTIGGNVVNVYHDAFKGCTGLKKITLLPGEANLNLLEDNIFLDCPIDTVIVHRENIEGYAFPTTRRINEVVLASDLRHFSDCLKFLGTTLFTNVIIEDSDQPLEIAGGNPIFMNCTVDSIYFGRNLTGEQGNIKANASFKHAEFGPKITEIDDYFVGFQHSLESVKLSQNVTSIKLHSFAQTAISEIEMPESLTEIGESAFSYCEKLKKAVLPGKLETIKNAAFYKTALQEIVLPASLKSIGYGAFENCTDLKNVIISDSDQPLEIAQGDAVFSHCSIDSIYFGRYLSGEQINIKTGATFKHAEFGPEITEIDDYFVRDQKSLESVKLSENVTEINFAAFYQTGISEIKLPASLIRIENSALKECPLKNIYCFSSTPSTCADKDVFSDEAYENTVVTVPPGSKKTYRNAEVWKLFKNLQSEGGGFKVTATYDNRFGKVELNGSSAASIAVDEDEPLTVAIYPAEGYKITSLTVNGADMTGMLVDNRLTYATIDSNFDINVEFGIITFAITLPADLSGGRIAINGADEIPSTIEYGSRIEIAAIPDRGHYLESISVNGTDVTSRLDENGVYTIEGVTADVTIDALFSPIILTVTATNSTGYGTVTLNGVGGECKVEFGKPLVIGIIPRNEGCYLKSLMVNDIDVTDKVSDGAYRIESVESDVNVESVFSIHTYTVEFEYDSSRGSILPGIAVEGNSVTVEHGSSLSLHIIPAEGYETATVTLDGKDVTDRIEPDETFTIANITADHRVQATFDIKRIRLNVLGLQGGILAMRYDYGTEATIIVEAEEGWEFNSLSIGDTLMTDLMPDNSYTTPALTDDTDVSVVFKQTGSGISSTDDDNAVTVYAHRQTVTVRGARDGEPVEIFDVSGTPVYRGTEHVIDVNRTGVYLVCVAGHTFKVMLR